MQTITAEELNKRLATGEKINLLDVREPQENAEFNIGGILLPLGKIKMMDTTGIDNLKSEEIICYCRSGNRSGQACLLLESMGFNNVKNLTGGMLEWQQKF
ncbi:MAG: rhodanese-like domain-containing protein [Agriterribacter sp.]